MRKSKLDVLIISGSFITNSHGGVATHVSYLAKGLSGLTKPFKRVRICKVNVLTTGKSRHKMKQSATLTIHELPGANGHFHAPDYVPSVGDTPLADAVTYVLDHWHE